MRRAFLLLASLLLVGCGGDTAQEAPLPAATPAAEAETATQPPSPLRPTQEAEPGTLPLGGVVAAPKGQTLAVPIDDDECVGFETFVDVRGGMQVKILGASGNIVALTALEPSTLSANGECFWLFRADVPEGERFYNAEIDSFGTSEVVAEADLASQVLVVLPD